MERRPNGAPSQWSARGRAEAPDTFRPSGRHMSVMQFYCPRGHLLECTESQIGQRSRCPKCGAELIVPEVAPAADKFGGPSTGPQRTGQPAMGRWATGLPATEPNVPVGPARDADGANALETDAPLIRRKGAQFADVTSAAVAAVAADDEERLVHIPCPAGHELETPLSMIGRDVMCPICRAEFRLHYDHSREYHTEQQQERLRREQKIGRAWMTWSLVAAALVLFGFALMIAVAMSN
jgi:hypothetical protein